MPVRRREQRTVGGSLASTSIERLLRDFDPANGRRPMSAVPCKPVGGDAIFRLPGRPVVAATVSSQPRQEAVIRREGRCLPRSASGDGGEFTQLAISGCSRPSGSEHPGSELAMAAEHPRRLHEGRTAAADICLRRRLALLYLFS